MNDNELIVVFALGALFGAAIVLMVALHADSVEGPTLTFSEDGLYDRQLAVSLPESGASVDCSFSRRNEFQIAESVFLYNETECSTTFSVGDGNVSVSSSGVDVLFRAGELDEEFSMGYDFTDNALVCNISEADREENSWDQYPADCGVVDEDISESWNDANFTDFNVVERGQESLRNESSG